MTLSITNLITLLDCYHFLSLWLFVIVFIELCTSSELGKNDKPYTTANINITYKDPITGSMRSEKEESGIYASNSPLLSQLGLVVHTRTANNNTCGCSPIVNVPHETWIALIARGNCTFTEKIQNAAVYQNSSAVVIYDNVINPNGDKVKILHSVANVVSISINKVFAQKIINLVDNGTKVYMRISVGRQEHSPYNNSINKTSVLFVSISFIVLMVISLAWLVFYYIQRFRYAHAKEALSKRLVNAARKAVSKMPTKTVKAGDKEVDSEFYQCAVCIEIYKISDTLRILPCSHMFHKTCVDPWLIEQRSCPMCKMDILKAYGLQVCGLKGSNDNVNQAEIEPLSTVTSEQAQAIGEEIHTVLYQPNTIQYHESNERSSGVDNSNSPDRCEKIPDADSLGSIHSADSDLMNELQSLMQKTDRNSPDSCNLAIL